MSDNIVEQDADLIEREMVRFGNEIADVARNGFKKRLPHNVISNQICAKVIDFFPELPRTELRKMTDNMFDEIVKAYKLEVEQKRTARKLEKKNKDPRNAVN